MKTLLIKNGGPGFCDECGSPLGLYKADRVQLNFDHVKVDLCPVCANKLIQKMLRLKTKCDF